MATAKRGYDPGTFLQAFVVVSNAHDGIVKHLQSNAPNNIVPARVTFTDETSIFLGGKEVRTKYFGRDHTNGDAFVYFPAHRLVHSGDSFASAAAAQASLSGPRRSMP